MTTRHPPYTNDEVVAALNKAEALGIPRNRPKGEQQIWADQVGVNLGTLLTWVHKADPATGVRPLKKGRTQGVASIRRSPTMLVADILRHRRAAAADIRELIELLSNS